MAQGPLGNVLRHIRQLMRRPDGDASSDGQLLQSFIAAHDEAAFAELLRRHGPMVLGVCRRLLQNTQDAEDAFQATFLVLLRRAGSIGKQESVGSWLYGVALRTALRARANARRRDRDREVAMPAFETPADATWDDLRPVIDREVGKLPEKFRAPVVLCYLEGKTNEEAAQQLHWPLGTVKTRLAQARDLLRERLTQRGIALTGGALAGLLEDHASAAVPEALLEATAGIALQSTLDHGTLAASAEVAALVKGVTRAMLMSKLKVVAGLLLIVGAIGGGTAGMLLGREDDPPVQEIAAPAPDASAPRNGEPLPTGAEGRLGTASLRHPSMVRGMALSTDGKLLATGAQDGIVRLWDMSTGRLLRELPTKATQKATLATGSSDTALASADNDGYVRVTAWTQYAHIDPAIPSVAISPDGKVLAAAASDKLVYLWELPSGKPMGQYTGHEKAAVYTVAFSPDSRTIASGAYDGSVRVWEVATLRDRVALPAPGQNGVHQVAFAPVGNVLAVRRTGITLHDAVSGKLLHTLKADAYTGHHDRGGYSIVKAMAFAPDGKTLAAWSSNENRTAATVIFDVATGKELRRFNDGGAVSYAIDGKSLFVGSQGHGDNSVRAWDPATAKECYLLTDKFPGQVEQITATPDGKSIAVHGPDHTIRLWDLEARTEIKPGQGHRKAILAMAASRDGKVMATGSKDGTICLWDVTARKQVRTFFGHGRGVQCLALSNDGKRLVSGGSDGKMWLWDVENDKQLGRLQDADPPNPKFDDGTFSPFSLALSPDGTLLATAHATQPIYIWEMATGKELRKLTNPKLSVAALAFAPDNKTLAVSGGNERIYLFDAATSKERGEIEGRGGHYGALAFSPDGKRLACSGNYHHDAVVWEMATRKEAQRVKTSNPWNGVPAVTFTPDSKAIVLGSGDAGARIFDVATGKERKKIDGGQGTISAFLYLNEGKLLATGGADTTVLLWPATRLAGE